MLVKLALRNIRRSLRDYSIYFVTLTIGVAIFYAFNSIESQQVIFDLHSSADEQMFEFCQQIISMFSGVIACVLGFLVIYANRFLIKRRKKEFGTYLLLGMRSVGVSGIVLMETLLVGVGALALGLLLGFLLSQALSFVTALLFQVQIADYQFVFSPDACLLTLGCFAIIFAIVALFNTFSVNRYKLIDLLNAEKRNERGGVRNPVVCLLAFIVSIGCLAFAYQQLAENGLVMLDDPQFARATVFMLVGSLLFFWSLAGFIIAVITRMRGVYLRGLTVFSVRQVASRINTAFLSLWAVCVLLFFSITTFSCGMGLVQVFADDVERSAPFSVTATADVYYASYKELVSPHSATHDERAAAMAEQYPAAYESGMAHDWNISSDLRERCGAEWDEVVAASADINEWEAVGTPYSELYNQLLSVRPDLGDLANMDGFPSGDTNVLVSGLSQTNDVLALLGKDPIALDEGSFAIVNNFAGTQDCAQAIVDNGLELIFGDTTLAAAGPVVDAQLFDTSMAGTILWIVVPDFVIDDFQAQGAIPNRCYMNADYVPDLEDGDERFDSMIKRAGVMDAFSQAETSDDSLEVSHDANNSGSETDDGWPVTSFVSQSTTVAANNGLRMAIIYLALYIGFVFLMATATILAIQRLSDTADSLPSYRTLSQLGCDQRMVSRSVLAQTLVYFLVPLGLAACHSACAVSVLNHTFFEPLGLPVAGPIALAAGLVVVVYGLYMLLTYAMSRSMARG